MSPSGIESLYQEELYQINSKVVVVLDKEWTSISDDDKALLNKILGSIKLSMAAVHIVAKPALSIKSLQFLSPTRVLIFGSRLEEDPRPYENITIQGISVIKADALNQLDDTRKKSLWGALKQMFAS